MCIYLKYARYRELTCEEKKRYPEYRYVTLSKGIYRYGKYLIVVPPGFLTDGNSAGPDFGEAWLFHDWLYATHKFTSGQKCSREQADKILGQIYDQEGMYFFAWIAMAASKMNFADAFQEAWEESGCRGPEFL